MEKFAEECLCHSRQRHPNIVQLIGVHYPEGSRLPMLVMEYLPLSLTQCLETCTDLLLQFKYSILVDVAKGLNYLHNKKPSIIHRDLTANNVLLTCNFVAKISDLGVSRMADTFRRHQFTTAPGNAVVMPPEALKDNPQYDHKLDVFSYGCLIVHVLTHQWPTPSDQFVPNPKDPKSFVQVTEFDRRLKFIQMISKDSPLLPLVEGCLCNDPKMRPAMGVVIQQLENVIFTSTPLKSKFEMMKEIDVLQKECETQKASNDTLLNKMASDQDNLKKAALEKGKIYSLLFLKEKELKEQTNVFLQCQQESIKKDGEISKLHSQLVSVRQDYEVLQNQVTEIRKEYEAKILAINKQAADDFQCVLKSKEETIEYLQSHVLSNPLQVDFKLQKELIQPLLSQRLRKRDKW